MYQHVWCYVELGMEPWASGMLGKHYTDWATSLDHMFVSGRICCHSLVTVHSEGSPFPPLYSLWCAYLLRCRLGVPTLSLNACSSDNCALLMSPWLLPNHHVPGSTYFMITPNSGLVRDEEIVWSWPHPLNTASISLNWELEESVGLGSNITNSLFIARLRIISWINILPFAVPQTL